MNNKLQPLPDGTSAALEFVKIICHIFALDSAVKDEVELLKSNLLRLIGNLHIFIYSSLIIAILQFR